MMRPTPRTFVPVVAAAALALVSVIGSGVGILLTLIKFKADYSCTGSVFSVCQEVGGDCAAVFSSPLSTWAGIPATVFATSFYLVSGIVALLSVFGRAPLYGNEGEFLGLMGVATLATSMVMAAYAKIQLDTFCLYCAMLYVVSLLFFGFSLKAVGRRPLDGLFYVFSFRWVGFGALKGLVVAGSTLSIAVVGQAWLYHGAHAGDISTHCIQVIKPLPKSELQTGSASPKWLFAEFVDPSCPFCRRQFEELHKLPTLEKYAGVLQLRVFMYPRDPECGPAGFTVRTKAATEQHACSAARSVLCADAVTGGNSGAGMSMMGEVLALQSTNTPHFRADKLAASAVKAGVTDAMTPESEFAKCMEQEGAKGQAVQARLQSHMRYGFNDDLHDTPRLYAIPVVDGKEQWEAARRFDGHPKLSTIEALLDVSPTDTPEVQ